MGRSKHDSTLQISSCPSVSPHTRPVLPVNPYHSFTGGFHHFLNREVMILEIEKVIQINIYFGGDFESSASVVGVLPRELGMVPWIDTASRCSPCPKLYMYTEMISVHRKIWTVFRTDFRVFWKDLHICSSSSKKLSRINFDHVVLSSRDFTEQRIHLSCQCLVPGTQTVGRGQPLSKFRKLHQQQSWCPLLRNDDSFKYLHPSQTFSASELQNQKV